MTLASQQARFRAAGRSSNTSNFRRRRKRRNGRVIGGVILGVLVIAAGWWIARRLGGGPSKAGAEPTPAKQVNHKNSNSSKTNASATDRHVAGATRPNSRRTLINTPPPPPAVKPQQQPDTGSTANPAVSDPLAKTESTEPPSPPPAQPRPAAAQPAGSGRAQSLFQQGQRALAENRPVEARQLLNQALGLPDASEAERDAFRKMIADINEKLIFSPVAYAGDPLTGQYKVQSGDYLSRIVPRLGLAVDWRFLVRINGLASASSLRVGQTIKIVRGPFHAVVHKDAYRLDLYAGDPPSAGSTGRADGAEDNWTYIRSFPVGLGAGDGTPIGNFIVRANSKLINPHWVNPRTGEKFDANDPKNPIGEHWLGLEGTDEATMHKTGYGLHGTIEPDSIGKDMSMGCVRMRPDDIAVVWETLTEGVSVVRIRQ